MQQLICATCGTKIDRAKTHTKGNFLIELILWCCFIIPGLLYTIWRVSTRSRICPKCHGTQLIPLDSPLGRKLAAE